MSSGFILILLLLCKTRKKNARTTKELDRPKNFFAHGSDCSRPTSTSAPCVVVRSPSLQGSNSNAADSNRRPNRQPPQSGHTKIPAAIAGMPRPPPPGRGAPGARRPMRDFFAAWLATLRSPLLPLLRRALSSSSGSWDDPLSSAAAAVEAHFQAHWSALDVAARQDPAQVVAAGDWRSPLELPFLWLGDVHPSLLTSLLRTLSPSPRLLAAADRVDRRIRAAVPAVSDRLRRAQEAFVAAEVAGAADVEAFLEELKGVALEANRLRRGVLSELVTAAGGYQAALYLEALSRFVLSMHDHEVLRRFDQCRPSPGS